ncbi:MAG: acylphosphatase, partial [Actinobacteria bacterium]|nr:acylphosphatase [Actinomycetota bacterium]
SCREQANAAGVEGSAQNLDDGRVEVVLEGDRDAVERVIEWCRQGPEGARVKSLEVDDERPRGESGFTLG